MSLENHPNLHAVGLAVDIIRAIESRLRGVAPKYVKKIMGSKDLSDLIVDFTTEVEDEVDRNCHE